MRFKFSVDQKAAIRGGYNHSGIVSIDIDVASLSQDDRDLLADSLAFDGQIAAVSGGGTQHFVVADAPTAEALIAAIRRTRALAAASAAQRQATEDAEIAECEAHDAQSLAQRRTKGQPGDWYADCGYLNYARGREAELAARNTPEWQAWQDELSAANAAHQAAVAAERLAAVRRQEAQTAAAKKRLADWVHAHGSETARLRLDDGYSCWVSAAVEEYADAAADRIARGAGLIPAEDPEGTDGQPVIEDRHCPTGGELAALRAVRALAEADEADAAVRLKYVRYDRCDDDDDAPEKQYRTEIEIAIDTGLGAEQRYYLAPSD